MNALKKRCTSYCPYIQPWTNTNAFAALKKIKWSSEDIARAISLRCVSPKAYRYMRDVLKIPLPGCSTLRRWASTIDMNPGVLTSVLHCMKAKGKSIPDIHRLLILTFDEMFE